MYLKMPQNVSKRTKNPKPSYIETSLAEHFRRLQYSTNSTSTETIIQYVSRRGR